MTWKESWIGFDDCWEWYWGNPEQYYRWILWGILEQSFWKKNLHSKDLERFLNMILSTLYELNGILGEHNKDTRRILRRTFGDYKPLFMISQSKILNESKTALWVILVGGPMISKLNFRRIRSTVLKEILSMFFRE